MSDIIKKIIPCNPYSKCMEQNSEELIKYLRMNLGAKDCECVSYDTPQFIDCGSNLEEVICPYCRSSLDFEWWGEAMDAAGESEFSNLNVLLPCCGKETSLNDLEYNMPCGFAASEIDILDGNEEIDEEINERVLSELSEIAGEKLRVIVAHY